MVCHFVCFAAYLQRREFNVIVVDWGAMAKLSIDALSFLAYTLVTDNVQLVGKLVAEFVIAINSAFGICNFGNIHLVGFSLGAHVAGVAGYEVWAQTGLGIGRITGLDPAGPNFDLNSDLNRKLDRTDAEFVDVIHTCAGLLGTGLELGTVEFYVNNGRDQPGCEPGFLAALFNKVTGTASNYNLVL